MQKAAIDQGVKLSPDEKATQRFEAKKQALIDAVVVGNMDAVQNAICNERDFEKRFRLVETLTGFLDMLQMAWVYDNRDTRSLDDMVQELNTQFAQHFAPDEATEARKQRSVDSMNSIYKAAIDTMGKYFKCEADEVPKAAAYVQFDISTKDDLSRHAYIINVDRAAILYFFVSHRRSFNPAKRNSVPASGDQVQPDDKPKELLTDEFKQEIISTFEALTAIYTNSERKPADELELVEWFEAAKAAQQADSNVPEVAQVEIDQYPHMFDPLTQYVWGRTREEMPEGQTIPVYSGKDKKTGEEAYISVKFSYLALDEQARKLNLKKLEELPIEYKKVYAIASAYCMAAKEHGLPLYFYLQDFVNAAGYYGNSGTETVKRILLELSAIIISVNNDRETQMGFKYPGFHYDGSLIPLEIRAETLKGKISPSVVHFLLDPPLQSLACGRGQFEMQPLWMLNIGTAKPLPAAVKDYLTTRISNWQHDCRKWKKRIDTLQKKSQSKKPLTITQQDELEKTQKKLSTPLKISKTTMCDRMPKPSVADVAADDDHELPPDMLNRREQKRQERTKDAVRQRNKRANVYAIRFLETCVANHVLSDFEETEKDYLLYK